MTQSELVLRAFAEEAATYWPMEYELLAVIAEQQSALLVAFLRANGAKNVGKPLTIPRPRHLTPAELDTQVSEGRHEAKSNVISFGAFKEMLERDES